MASVPLRVESEGILRFSAWDAMFVALAGLHGAMLLSFPIAPAIALGMWWNANTVSHNFIHRPFFRPRIANRLFSAYLSLVLGFPQTIWRDRHLAHHAAVSARLRASSQLVAEAVMVTAMWMTVATVRPRFFWTGYLPGWLLGLGMCALQGHYEHERGTISHYGRLYNWLCFNDGYHAEHHDYPGMHWMQLPEHIQRNAATSGWPPLLRWVDSFRPPLEVLERLVLRSASLQTVVLGCHRRAFQQLLRGLPYMRRVVIVGGGLFPRTALILRDLLPQATITVMDSNAENLATARALCNGSDIEWVHQHFNADGPCDCDLLVIPLSFRGSRQLLYRYPPVPAVLVHDWIWRRRGDSRVISAVLLKRLNLLVSPTPTR